VDTTPNTREQALKQIQAQIDALPDDHPRKALLTELSSGKPSAEAQQAQRDALKRVAVERHAALPDSDPLKAMLGRMIGNLSEGPAQSSPPIRPSQADVQHDIWAVVDVLGQRDEALFRGIQTIDARSAAAMQEAQRLAAQSVELQELLNIVLEEVHANTAMLKDLQRALPKVL
jgi:hypothetical protein